MNIQYTWLDWGVFGLYFMVLAFIGWYFNQTKSRNTNDYFLGGNSMPIWVVAISVLATSQSAATFLGGPDQGYQGNMTYLATNIGALLAVFFVAIYLIPKFYQYKVSTVYEFLEVKFGESAKKQSGYMYLFGRVFASGARLYLAAIAVAMILFGNISAQSVVFAIVILTALGLAYSVIGGIRSVIYSDAIQCFVYISAALCVIYFLLDAIPADFSQIITALQEPSNGQVSKLTILNFNLDFSSAGVFSFWSSITGFVLLNIAAFGLDQDMTQRILTCKNAKDGVKAMIWSVVLVIPVMAIFIFIGLLLYIFYQRPDLMQLSDSNEIIQNFDGEKITIFMYYILNEIPSGVKGLVTVGVIAAALSTLNSGLNSMSSVIIQDIYRPYIKKSNKQYSDRHFVIAGQFGMIISALFLASMAILCFYWQRYTQMPLLAFALSVMVFSYSGLLGVYFTALFTNRGSKHSVLASLVGGALITFSMQPYVLNSLHPAFAEVNIGFSWQLCIGTFCAFIICCLGKQSKKVQTEFNKAINA
ncbi:sodium:solute symporter [Colwellia sp. RSH04]|uniref:sodium:solute symporter n=1 Tax=Colwellia sp. RSH04 TaxID=2305464 RepID=UPI000E571126|nr:sodium:solute symporter [Colwellia sp. RSH04]RHW76482.1 sodium:solute symporter [Colwellia sp. RSH04]